MINTVLQSFHSLYEKTTNPRESLENILTDKMMYFSIIAHSFVYTMIILFLKEYLNPKFTFSTIQYDFIFGKKLFSLLCIVMFFGYIGRFLRLRAVYANMTLNEKRTFKQTRDIAYFRFYFLG